MQDALEDDSAYSILVGQPEEKIPHGTCIDGRVILKWLKKGRLAGTCEHGNKLSVHIKGGETF
jgi:hypothetical protein